MVHDLQQQAMDAANREFAPETYPPFPRGLPMVELETISLAQLEANNVKEHDRLFRICKQQGFFHLDFAGTSASSLPNDVEEIARVTEDVSKLPFEEKVKYRFDATDNQFGYKGVGWGITDHKGTPDTNEFLNVSKDEMTHPAGPTLPWPQPVLSAKPLFAKYMQTAHSTGLFLLSILATKLNLTPDTFDHLHDFSSPSGDHVRMARGPPRKDLSRPEIQTAGHTDFGTVTVLFNWLGGLQIWSEPSRGNFKCVIDPESPITVDGQKAQWLWVKPKPGHAIINLGDAAVKFTNGLFCSGRHRVVPAPGEQGLFPRYSVVYFVRPVDRAVLKTLESEMIVQPEEGTEEEVTAREWIGRQMAQMKQKKGDIVAAQG